LPTTVNASYLRAANFTVRNGQINQGRGGGYSSSPLFCPYLPGLTITNVQTYATGMDTISLMANFASVQVTVRGSTFQQNIDNISNRINNYSTLALYDINGPVLIDGNQILNSPQVGINVGFNNPQYPVVIQNNVIRPNEVVGNGYGIEIAGLQNFTIANNSIVAVNGRGIDVDGWSSTPIANGQIYGNFVSVQEHGNREDNNANMEARALRLRNDVDQMGPQTNVHIYNNTFLATTGPGLGLAAYAVRISYLNPNGEMNNANILIENNTFRAIVTTTDPTYTAQAMLVDGVAPGINLVCSGNILESNDTSLALSGADLGNVSGVLLVSNTLRKSSVGAARPYTGIRAGYLNYQIHNVMLIDTRTDNGATATIVWSGSGTKDIGVGWLLSVTTTNAAGTPLAGAIVALSDNTGTQVFTGMTGSNGQVANIPVVTTLYTQSGTNPAVITTSIRRPISVTVISGVLVGLQTVDLTADTTITVTLS
jgi:hypothetical protein